MDSESDVPPEGTGDKDDDERAGLYLAAIIALAVPALIVLAFVLSSTGTSIGGSGSQTANSGLDRLDVESGEDDEVTVEVAGAGASQDEVSVDIGSAASMTAEDAASGASASASGDDSGNASGEATSTTAASDDAPAATTNAPTTSRAGLDGDDRGADDQDRNDQADQTTTTTTAPTTSTATTTRTNSSTSTTSTTTTSTTTTNAPAEEPAEFAQRIDIGRIGESTLQFRFSSATTTSYVVTVRSGTTVVTSKSGGAQANQLVNETVQGLTPGTDYTVQVTLNGPPSADSPRVAFRTSGGADPAPAEESVAIQGLRLVSTSATRFEVNYESNICANGSFVIREQGGGTVGSNSGQASGCTTRHLAIPGFWTPALTPNTTYVITVTVEANGAGKGNGNTASQSLTVTTSG